MFTPIKKGTVERIYKYDCWIPPYGYGTHVSTGELAPVDVIKRSNNIKEQFWERTPLPDNWKQRVAKEARQQETDPEYYDKELQAFRDQQWHRREYGVWVWLYNPYKKKSEAVYFTGRYYTYLNWWKIDIGYPRFRESNRKVFYVLQYCTEDPRCGGLVETAKRRDGKSYRAGFFQAEIITRTMNSEGGTQSKTGKDAKKFFRRSIIIPFKSFPDFFKPIFDTSTGITPQSVIRFNHTNKRGKDALRDIDAAELNSFMDFESSDLLAYDGQKKLWKTDDESGKTIEVDIYERHQVNRYCIETDGEWTGFDHHTTTVEEMENGGKAFKKLWDESDPNIRDENGHTKTGMYHYFASAFETLYNKEDEKYGYPDIDKAKVYYMNRRAAYANDPRTLSGEIRKNPFTEAEMFRIDGDKCLWNPELLNNRRDELSWKTNLTTRGDFMWEKGVRDTKVVFKPSKTGRFQLCWNFEKEGESNKFIKRGSLFYPDNKLYFVAGSDPFSHDKTVDNRRSMACSYVRRKFKSTYGEDDKYNGAMVCRYYGRPELTAVYYEDMIMMCAYFGCQILFENNKIGWKSYFITRGYEGFLIKLSEYDEYGMPGNQKTHQELAEAIESEIETNVDRMHFVEAVEDMLTFDIDDTTKFDDTMAYGYTLIADSKVLFRKRNTKLVPVNSLYHTYSLNQ